MNVVNNTIYLKVIIYLFMLDKKTAKKLQKVEKQHL